MIQKKLIAMSLGVTLVASVTTAMADGLSLTNIDVPSSIQVNCNGTQLPSSYELNPGQSVNDLPWWVVSAAFGGSQALDCSFTLDNATHDLVGKAKLNLNVLAGEGEAEDVQSNSSYSVTVSPGLNNYVQSMTVTIRKIKTV